MALERFSFSTQVPPPVNQWKRKRECGLTSSLHCSLQESPDLGTSLGKTAEHVSITKDDTGIPILLRAAKQRLKMDKPWMLCGSLRCKGAKIGALRVRMLIQCPGSLQEEAQMHKQKLRTK